MDPLGTTRDLSGVPLPFFGRLVKCCYFISFIVFFTYGTPLKAPPGLHSALLAELFVGRVRASFRYSVLYILRSIMGSLWASKT